MRFGPSAVKSEDGATSSGSNTANVLYLLDSAFAAPTPLSNYGQHEQKIAELAYDKGVLPSVALTRIHQLVRMRAGSDSPGVWEETCGRMSEMLHLLVKDHPELRPFSDQIAKIDFEKRPYDDWYRQFLVFESEPTFKESFDGMHLTSRTTNRLCERS